MPLVDVTLIEGRPADAKAALIAKLTHAVVEAIGAPCESVRVLLREVPASHWGVGGVSKAAQSPSEDQQRA